MSLTQIVNQTLGPKRVDGPLCSGCVLEHTGERFIPHDGTGSNGVLLLADSPWKTEIQKGYLLAGPSGQLLERVFSSLGVSRRSFLLANGSTWCKPPELGWTDRQPLSPDAALAVSQCRPYLDDLVAKAKPKVIVTLGGAALRRVAGTNDVTAFQNYVLDSCYGIPVIPTYHPSYLFRPGKKKLMFSVLCAVRKALDIAAGKAPAKVSDTLLLDPSYDEAKAYLEAGLVNGRFPFLYTDIETPMAAGGEDGIDIEDRAYDTTGKLGESYQIHRVGLSYKKNTALTLPWSPPYIDLILWALERADVFIEHAHNNYDSRRLRANGARLNGAIASSMWAWHFYQSDLDKALGFVTPFFCNTSPHKHLNEINPPLYNALDVARGLDIWLGCEEALKAEGRWEAFWRESVEFGALLKQVELKGVCVDAEGKATLMSELREEIKTDEQSFLSTVPSAARKVTIKKVKPKKDPQKYIELVMPVTKRKRKKGWKGCPACTTVGVPRAKGKLHDCYFELVTEDKTVWKKEEFNAGSSDQVKGLLRELGITVPKKRNKDGEQVETTGKKQLQRIAKKNEQLRPILIIRAKRKLVEAYDWPIEADGRVRTFYGFGPSTWRLSSWFQNLQTIPKRGDFAPRFRKLIKAAPGHLIGEVDSAAIEAVLVGYFGGSDRYLRLAKAGVHGWLTAAKMGQPISLDLPFDELTKKCKAAKQANPKLYDSMKVTVHLSNYDGEDWSIYEQNPDVIESPEEAKKLQQFYFATEPGKDVRKWQDETRQRAYSQRFLQTPYGVKHWFFAVYAYNQFRECWEPDKAGDGKRCLAFMPQSTGASVQRYYGRIFAQRYPEYVPFLRLFTHDSISLEYPEGLKEEPVRKLAEVMLEPLPNLGDLTVGVEAKVGLDFYNLGDVRL